jgi:uncharacterized protein (TIGR02246 family)
VAATLAKVALRPVDGQRAGGVVAAQVTSREKGQTIAAWSTHGDAPAAGLPGPVSAKASPQGETTMRPSMLLASAALLAGLSNVALASDDSASACFQKAFVANDARAVAQCYAVDAVMWFPGGPMATGRDAIGAAYAGFLGANTIKSVVLSEIGNRTIGDDRVAWGTYTIVMVVSESGAEVTQTGRYTDVSRRIDGRWQYVVDHPSDDPPPAAVDATAALAD